MAILQMGLLSPVHLYLVAVYKMFAVVQLCHSAHLEGPVVLEVDLPAPQPFLKAPSVLFVW